MPRFYFHTQAETRFTQAETRFNDSEGVELSGVEEARVQAAISAGEVLKDNARVFWGTQPWTLTVTDQDGLIFFTLGLHAADRAAADRP